MRRCIAKTLNGNRCKNPAEPGGIFCKAHLRQLEAAHFDWEANERHREKLRRYNRRQRRREQKIAKLMERIDTGDEAALDELRAMPNGEDLPDFFATMRCGAQTRAATPCRRTDIYSNGRCKLHGGLSTGPKTKAGLRRVTANLPGRVQSP